MKVRLYIRQRGTREFQQHNPEKSYQQNGSIIWFLRYGSTWETLDVKTLSEATSLRLRRQIDARSEAAASRSRPFFFARNRNNRGLDIRRIPEKVESCLRISIRFPAQPPVFSGRPFR